MAAAYRLSPQAEYVIGDYLFILWDSFGANLNPTEHSDGTYTPPDVDQILQIMSQYPEKKVIQTGGWASTAPSGATPWGVRDLYLEEDRICSGYIIPSQKLVHRGNEYTVAARYQDTVEITV